jgi:hypothetical protein
MGNGIYFKIAGGQKAIQLLKKKSEILLEEYNLHVIV